MAMLVEGPNGIVIEFPDGTDDATIGKAFAQVAQPAKRAQTAEQKAVAEWRKANPKTAYAFDVAHNLVRGLPVGSFADEALATVRSLRSGNSYDAEKRMVNAMTEAASNDTTTLATLPFVGDVTTGGLTSLASGIATAPLAPVARVMQGISLLPRAVNMGISGGLYGALYGAGEGDTVQERAGNARTGLAVGTSLGVAAPTFAAGAGNVAARIRDARAPLPRGIQRFERGAVERVRQAAEMDNLDAGSVAVLNRMGRPAVLADAGENLRTITEGINQQPGPARRVISETLRRRRAGAQARINADVDGALGPAANLPATIRATEQQYQQAARPFYDQFRQQQIPVDQELVAILQAVPDNIWPRVQEKIRMERLDPANVANTGRGIDLIKRALDDAAGAAQRANQRDDYRLYSNLARDLRTHVDRLLSPNDPAQSPWAQGRAIAEEGFNVQDAIEEGRNAFNRNLSADQLEANMQGMNQLERESTRLGAREALRSQMANAGTAFRESGDVKARQLLNSPEARRKAEMLATSPQAAQQLNTRIGTENTFAETYDQVMGNSATARRQAARNIIPRQYDAASMRELRGTSFSGAIAEGMGRIANFLTAGYLNERNARIASQMAEMLVAQGVSRENIANGILQMMQRQRMTAARRNQVNQFVERVIRGTSPVAIESATAP